MIAWRTFLRTVGLWIAGVAGLLATVSGCVAAVSWAIGAVGVVPVAIAGAFLAGCVIGAAATRATRSPLTPRSG